MNDQRPLTFHPIADMADIPLSPRPRDFRSGFFYTAGVKTS
jgi:hypothetical protein